MTGRISAVSMVIRVSILVIAAWVISQVFDFALGWHDKTGDILVFVVLSKVVELEMKMEKIK